MKKFGYATLLLAALSAPGCGGSNAPTQPTEQDKAKIVEHDKDVNAAESAQSKKK
jgi:hypothetical protein